jgi:hypothetical protein
LFAELLRKLDSTQTPFSDYTYVGLGGPYLEDFNLLQSTVGNKKMISLETEPMVITRQRLNQPHCRVELTLDSTTKFVRKYYGRTPLIVWFDHSKPEWQEQITDCCDLLRKLPPMSIFKITFSASTKHLADGSQPDTMESRAEKLNEQFRDFGPFNSNHLQKRNFPNSLYGIFKKAIQDSVPDTAKRAVRSLASYKYDDGTPILTITCIVGPIDKIDLLIAEKRLKSWPFADINWRGPVEITIPHLSFRERMAIDRLLPDASARTIVRKLGLRLAEDYEESVKIISDYILFYKHVPHFVRVHI